MNLPIEIQYEIFKYLPIHELLILSRCPTFSYIKNIDIIWKYYIFDEISRPTFRNMKLINTCKYCNLLQFNTDNNTNFINYYEALSYVLKVNDEIKNCVIYDDMKVVNILCHLIDNKNLSIFYYFINKNISILVRPRYLGYEGDDMNFQEWADKLSKLCHSVFNSNSNDMFSLLSYIVDIHYLISHIHQYIFYVIKNGNLMLLQYILNNNNTGDVQNNMKKYISESVKYGHIDILKYLLRDKQSYFDTQLIKLLIEISMKRDDIDIYRTLIPYQ